LIQLLIWRFGGVGLERTTYQYVASRLGDAKFDFCFINHGETIGPELVRLLKVRCRYVAAFNADNPFVGRDGSRWRIVLKALPQYDSFVTPRSSSVDRALAFGARHVIRYVQTADEIVHRTLPWNEVDATTYGSDIAFVGTWMPERGLFAAKLLQAGLPIRIFGANWHKAPEYAVLARSLAVSSFLKDAEYVRAVQYAKIAVGLVSEQNQDEHTNRSVEIPALGSLLCAKRTPQHLEMYQEDVEAVFWRNADECISKCRALLAAPDRLASIAAAGHVRMVSSTNWNEPLMQRVLDETIAVADAQSRGA